MSCRCQERAQAIIAGMKAIARGDYEAAKASGRFVVETAAEDAAVVARRARAAAVARLAGGRRR